MKIFDLIRLVLGNLNRRKGRVGLTAIGVVIGTAAVVVLVSLAIGLQRNANEQLYGIGDLTQIQVSPGYAMEGGGGGMSGVKVAVPAGKGGGGGGDSGTTTLLTNDALETIRAIPGVAAIIPRDYFFGGVNMKYKRLEGGANIIGVGTDSLANLGLVAEQGVLELAKGTVIIGAQVPNNFYSPNMRPGQTPPPPPDLYDQMISFVFMKWDQDGNEIRKTMPLRVAGVIKETKGESDWSIYMGLDEMKVYNEWASGTHINYNKTGYNQVLVKVDSVEHVLDVNDQITALGFQAYTPLSFVQGINNFYQILQVIFGGVGAIALLVAAIGIANTMAMAILERTREIGLMKAIGATNRDVLTIFLGEAAGIGFVGGLGGILIGWLAGQLLNVAAIVYLSGQMSQQGGAPPSIAVYTPGWLPAFALLFSTLIGLVSGLYPALRAATMVPVNALKYE
jgi:putative ABC transport system permease protein